MTDETREDADDTEDAEPSSDDFETELARARELLAADDLTAFHVGVVRDGEAVETTFSYRAEDVDPDREGIQALTLLATHIRVVADEAGVDRQTAAADATALAGQVEETEGTLTD